MAQKQDQQTKQSGTIKRKRPVAIDEQNPASTDVQALVESLAKRKERKKKKS
jgi:outer membrane lipoprotein SlyB